MNDPRLTSYALGQLHGPERDAFEKDLAASAALQSELAAIVALTDALSALAPAADNHFTDDQRASLRDECLQNTRIIRRRLLTRRIVLGSSLAALAACLVILPMTPWFQLSPERLASAAQRKVDVLKVSPWAPLSHSESVNGFDGSKLVVDEKNLAIKRPSDAVLLPPSEATPSGTSQALVASAALTTTPVFEGASRNVVLFVSPPAAASGNIAATAPVHRDQTKALSGDSRYVDAEHTTSAELAKSKSRQAQGGMPSAGWDSLYMFRGVNVLQQPQPSSTDESYDAHADNTFLEARANPLSTFSIDVDTASYSNIRRMLLDDQLPPEGAVRIEEMVNYFTYAYPQPRGDAPFSVNVEVARSPWNPRLDLVRIGLKGREIPKGDRGPANLVFLIDVSGSMSSENKLPLLKRSLEAMVKNLSPEDRVAIVVYAGASGLVLPSTPGADRQRIIEAIANLRSGGGTNGAAGIQLAYQVARENFLKGGNNRVILCTDGDFNVGVTNQDELVRLIENERSSGVFLSVLGFGSGNLKDSTMEKLADKGNGNYAYIDSFSEGRKVLIDQMDSTLFTIAKDVKIQVEFNPAHVAAYRLIGYENRLLAKEDFNDDRKDAGEIGAGHTVTALYEVVPVGQPIPNHPSVDPLKYQSPAPTPPSPVAAPVSGELLTVKLRYKAPDGSVSKLIEVPVVADSDLSFDHASSDFQFAAAVAAFGMKLRQSPGVEGFKWEDIQAISRRNLGSDPGSYRAEFLTLIEKAARLAPQNP